MVIEMADNSYNKIEPTSRTRIKTNAKRAVYDFNVLTSILDETFICHVGYSIENQPFVIPTCFGRKDNKIYFHGAKGSKTLKSLKNGIEVCVNITILDGIVLARSAFHHSINYRSVVIFGKAKEITKIPEKINSLIIITGHIIPDRWDDVRKPNEKELNATSVFSLDINESSVKMREGSPIDEPDDMNLKVWAGVIPFKTKIENPVKDPKLSSDIILPDYIRNYRK